MYFHPSKLQAGMIVLPLNVELNIQIAKRVFVLIYLSLALWSAFVSNLTSDNIEMVSSTLQSIKTKLIRCLVVHN